MKAILLKDREGKTVLFPSIKSVIAMINEDRSEEWSDYNYSDWKEGLAEFTEYDFVSIKAKEAK